MVTAEANIFPDFASDCSACAALCCVGLHFDAGHGFGIDKDAGTPCPNLSDTDFKCRIHDRLSSKGFTGCVSFHCLGAGQRTVQEIFKGADWRQSPELLPDMIEGFRILRRVHEALEIISLISKLPLTAIQTETLAGLIRMFTPAERDWSLPELQALEATGCFARYKSDLKQFQSALAIPNALAAQRAES